MSHVYAVVPAAGRSRRMGRPKLLLELGGKTVIARLIETLAAAPQVQACVVVVRRNDWDLAAAARDAGAVVVQPEVDPPDMRSSVQHALREIREKFVPGADDAWALIPADHPLLTPEALSAILDAWEQTAVPLLIPTHGGRGGHPTLFRWPLAAEVPGLPPDCGLNELVRRNAEEALQCEVPYPEILWDLDTPDDLERARSRLASRGL